MKCKPVQARTAVFMMADNMPTSIPRRTTASSAWKVRSAITVTVCRSSMCRTRRAPNSSPTGGCPGSARVKRKTIKNGANTVTVNRGRRYTVRCMCRPRLRMVASLATAPGVPSACWCTIFPTSATRNSSAVFIRRWRRAVCPFTPLISRA